MRLLIFLSSIRPIAAGALQGSENFIAFGFARLALALGRIALLFFLIRAGLGLRGSSRCSAVRLADQCYLRIFSRWKNVLDKNQRGTGKSPARRLEAFLLCTHGLSRLYVSDQP